MSNPIVEDTNPALARQLGDLDHDAPISGRLTGEYGQPAPLGRIGVELVISVVVAAVVSLAVQFVADRLHIPMPSYAPTALMVLGAVLLFAAALWLAGARRWRIWVTPLCWAVLSGIGTVPLAVLLQGTKFYLFGISGDQFFRTQYLVRLATSPKLADGNYFGLPSYYPASWFWLGGRFADLFGLQPWQAYKPFAILTIAVAPVIAFGLWSALVRRPVALLLAVLTCLAGLRVGAYEPYAWLVTAPMPPMVVLGWRYFRSAVVRPAGRNVSILVTLGVYFGVCGAMYTMLFGFFGLLLVVLGIAAVWLAWWRQRAGKDTVAIGAVVRQVVLRGVLIGLIALPIVLLVWTPYLLGVLTGHPGANVALRYLPEAGAELPTPMFEASVSGAVCLLGFGWIILALRRSQLAQALGMFVGACYAWYLLSFAALAAHTTLLAFDTRGPLSTALFCAGGLAAIDLARWAGARPSIAARVPVRLVATALAVLGLAELVQTYPASLQQITGADLIGQAYQEYDDTGVNALGNSDPSQPGAWNGKLISTVAGMTGKQPQNLIMLTSDTALLALRPYSGFQTSVNPYANPLANYDDRRAEIETWGKSANSDALLHDLDSSKYQPPTVFVLSRQGDGLHLTVSMDVFPLAGDNAYHDVVFQPSLFDNAQFDVRQVGPFTVAVRR